MRKWKSFMAAGLTAAMLASSCMPQIMWASEFSAENSETMQASENIFEDGTDDLSHDKYMEDFETGEEDPISSGDENKEKTEQDEQTPEKEETTGEEMNAESAEGYTVQLYSLGKLEKTYVISYADAASAKAPAALTGRSGYIFKEWNTKEDGTGEAYKPGESMKKLLDAMETATEVQSQNLEMNQESAGSETSQSEPETLAEVSEAAQSEINESTEVPEVVPSETDTDQTVNAETSTAQDTVVLYAIWEKAATYKITYKLNKGTNNSANPKTYTGAEKVTLKNPTRSGYHFAGWYTDSNYKKKISAIEKGTKGALTLYAKWIKEVNASSGAATLTSIRGAKAKTISASVTVPAYVKSADAYYYLVYVDSNSGKVKKAAAQVKKPEKSNGKITFKLDISGHPEYAQGKFAVAVKKTKSAYTVISKRNYVSNPEKLSANTVAYFVPKTKKGIQATDINQITETKSKTAFFNIFASEVMSSYGGEAYKYNGKTYYFNGLYGYQALVQQCNAKGIQVTAQISLDKNSVTQNMTTGNSPYGDTAYYGWNTNNSVARQTMEAMFAYLGEKFGRNDCYISNWILGNEINSASRYYCVGNVSFSKFISMYSEAFRCLYNAVRSSRGSSKVFICLDNCWNQKNIFSVCYTSKSTLDSFASTVSRLQKGINWNLAYHAYSQPLTEEKFWSSMNAPLLTNDGNSATFITMHNIQALTNYVKSKFGSGTRVILSEQGFSSSFGGQEKQAASMALAYYKAACNPMIDAFIIRSYQDEAIEVAQGLALGLRDAKGKKKTVYNVFCNMDSSNSLKYTEKILNNQVGNWKAQIPGYTAKRVSSMYRN